VDEMAVYFSISMRALYRLLDEGDLQATKVRGYTNSDTNGFEKIRLPIA